MKYSFSYIQYLSLHLLVHPGGMEKRQCGYHRRGKAPCQKFCHNETLYCVIHQPLLSFSSDQRIPCQDCHQMIKESCLEKHGRVCSKKPTKQPSYYQQGINNPITILGNHLHDVVNTVNIENLIWKINELYRLYVFPMLGPRRYGDLNTNINPSEKHRRQESSIYEQLCSNHIIDGGSPNVITFFLDLGSGKGSLSKYISQQDIPRGSIFICIEKSHYKHQSERNSHSCGHTSHRIQIDLRDVHFSELIQSISVDKKDTLIYKNQSEVEVIGIGKHLCGNATDTAILGLLNLLSPSSSLLLRGIGIALCCHSNCHWNSSLCTKWFQSLPLELQIFENEWEYLRKWSGMFALNDKETELDQLKSKPPGDEGLGDNLSMTYAERVNLGRMCKRLIDYGRVEYIRHESEMSASLVYYTEESITPENVMLLACKRM